MAAKEPLRVPLHKVDVDIDISQTADPKEFERQIMRHVPKSESKANARGSRRKSWAKSGLAVLAAKR
jgi:hypothetical protein